MKTKGKNVIKMGEFLPMDRLVIEYFGLMYDFMANQIKYLPNILLKRKIKCIFYK